MHLSTFKKHVFVYVKSFSTLIVSAFILSVIFKGIGFFMMEYFKESSLVFSMLVLFATLATVAISFFSSAYILGENISIVSCFIFPVFYKVVILALLSVKHFNTNEVDTHFENWYSLLLVVLFSYIFSYIGAKSSRKNNFPFLGVDPSSPEALKNRTIS